MSLKFLQPINGDVLHTRDAAIVDGTIIYPVSVSAPCGKKVTINEIEAVEENGVYTAAVPIKGYPAEVIAECECGTKEKISVYVAPEYANKYRVSIDDAIWFLKDIYENEYDSIFDNPFLKFFRELHEEYGIKLHINLYLVDNDDGGVECEERFSITSFPDRYRDEWRANADWIRLSFHARANYPAKPYLGASYETMYRDAKAVRDEIIRFAGEELLGPATTLHWGDATMDGCRALCDLGWSILPEDFNVDDGKVPVSLYLSVEERRHMKKRFIWHDDRIGATMFRCGIITDTHKLEDIPAFLDEVNEDPIRGAYMDLLIHEQYFYEHYVLYQPDYRDKVRAAVEWAVKNGYTPGFLGDVLHG